ncbi:metallophosphoesterase family protein [Bacillus sp. JJ1764]|uniref:metallophosphoesterase family protein n=1 Tax=Bacillus sp. JJ1764 TaxID=3122964 RepID=UPI0030009AEB
MKIAFISDIHGNAVALEAVLNDIKKRDLDKVFVLGDICYRGPEPKRSLDLVRSLNTKVIKGNADEWVIRGIMDGEVPESVSKMMSKERDWIFSHLDDTDITYLQELPSELNLKIENVKIHAYHATPNSLFEVVLPNESDENVKGKMMTEDADLYVYAHIHKPFIRYIDGKCIINIGSVGLPFDGLTMASYALIEIESSFYQASIVRVKYDLDKVIEQFSVSDYPNKEKMIKVILEAKI